MRSVLAVLTVLPILRWSRREPEEAGVHIPTRRQRAADVPAEREVVGGQQSSSIEVAIMRSGERAS